MHDLTMSLDLTGHRKIVRLETGVAVGGAANRESNAEVSLSECVVETYDAFDTDTFEMPGRRSRRKQDNVFATAMAERGNIWTHDQLGTLSLNDPDDTAARESIRYVLPRFSLHLFVIH